MPTKTPLKSSNALGKVNFPMPLFHRRSDELAGDFEKMFADRCIKTFAAERSNKLKHLRVEGEKFLEAVRCEFVWSPNGTTKYVTMTRLIKVIKKSPPEIRQLLPHSTVMMLVKLTNFNLTIDLVLIEELVKMLVHSEEIYVQILPYCENSREISTDGLQAFVREYYIPKMVEVPEREEYYAAYAAEIIFFLLDSRRRESIFLKDLFTSTLLLQMEACIRAENDCFEMPTNDVFTVSSFRAALHEFRSLDVDRNGVLSEEELQQFRNCCFNPLFIKRVFEISMTYEKGCLDFKGFVDLICAVKFRHTGASAKYHFEALDLKEDGVLDEEEIRTTAKWMNRYSPDEPELNTDVLSAELQDMLSANQTITLENFVKNFMTPVFTGFISNYADYMKYERREQ